MVVVAETILAIMCRKIAHKLCDIKILWSICIAKEKVQISPDKPNKHILGTRKSISNMTMELILKTELKSSELIDWIL